MERKSVDSSSIKTMGILKMSVWFFIALTFLSGVISTKPRPRIVGGKVMNMTEVPWVVQIEKTGQVLYSGNIISKYHVLTAGECVWGISPDQVTIRVGSEIKNHGGVVHEIEWGYHHPHFVNQFGTYYWQYDIAVIKVKQPFEFGPKVQPIGFGKVNPKKKGLITGWGDLSEGDYGDGLLRGVKVPINEDGELCNLYDENLQFCSGDRDHAGCSGDWGAGFVQNNKIVGIANMFHFCDYTSIVNIANETFIDFIESLTDLSIGKLYELN